MRKSCGIILKFPIIRLIRWEDQKYQESVPSDSRSTEGDTVQSRDRSQAEATSKTEYPAKEERKNGTKAGEEDEDGEFIDENTKEEVGDTDAGTAEYVIIKSEEFNENCDVKREENVAKLEEYSVRVKEENGGALQEYESIIKNEEFNWDKKPKNDGANEECNARVKKEDDITYFKGELIIKDEEDEENVDESELDGLSQVGAETLGRDDEEEEGQENNEEAMEVDALIIEKGKSDNNCDEKEGRNVVTSRRGNIRVKKEDVTFHVGELIIKDEEFDIDTEEFGEPELERLSEVFDDDCNDEQSNSLVADEECNVKVKVEHGVTFHEGELIIKDEKFDCDEEEKEYNEDGEEEEEEDNDEYEEEDDDEYEEEEEEEEDDEEEVDDPELEKLSEVVGKKIHKCKICSNKYPTIGRLREHKMVHTGQKRHKCTKCNKSFLRKSYLIGHMNTHTGERPYKCATCTKGFFQKSHLRQHKLIHASDKPYKCRICNKGYSRKHYVIGHEKTHKSKKPFKCTSCNKGYSQKACLIEHKMRKHTVDLDMPFKCAACNKRFTQKVDMTRHEKTHTVHKCATCKREFFQKRLMIEHERIHTGERPYQCVTCKTKFMRIGHLRRHEKTHTKERSHKCKICKKGFYRKDKLVEHERIHIDGERRSTLKVKS